MWIGCVASQLTLHPFVYISAGNTNGTYGPANGFGESIVTDLVALRRLNVSLAIKVCGVTPNIVDSRSIHSRYVVPLL